MSKQKIEALQVWQKIDNPEIRGVITGEYDGGYGLAGVVRSPKEIRKNYTLYRHADGTLANPEPVRDSYDEPNPTPCDHAGYHRCWKCGEVMRDDLVTKQTSLPNTDEVVCTECDHVFTKGSNDLCPYCTGNLNDYPKADGLSEERCKQLMEQVGLPDSQSLKTALQQVANEIAQQHAPPPDTHDKCQCLYHVEGLWKLPAEVERLEADKWWVSWDKIGEALFNKTDIEPVERTCEWVMNREAGKHKPACTDEVFLIDIYNLIGTPCYCGGLIK